MTTTRTLLIAATLTAGAMLAVANPVFAADETTSVKTKIETRNDQKSDGSGEQQKKIRAESTDAAGTKTTEETVVKEKVDEKGDGSRTVETTTTTDPEGLMNKSTTTTTDKTEVKDGKATLHREKKVDGKVVDETKESVTR